MVEQMTLFGIWEQVEPEPDPPGPSPLPADPWPAPVPVLPGQTSLLVGLHAERRQMELALQTLDPAALRRAAQQARKNYPAAEEGKLWQRWVKGLQQQLGSEDEPLGAAEQVARAQQLLQPRFCQKRFPDMPPPLLVELRRTLLSRAHDRLVAEQGAAARLPDGRAAGVLLLQAGEIERAVRSLRAALEQVPRDARLLADLAVALFRSGRRPKALVAWREALLLEPDVVEEAELEGTPWDSLLDEAEELELSGPGKSWLPVLGDLKQVVPLPGWVARKKKWAGAEPWRTCAALLSRLRQLPRREEHQPERTELKRTLLGVAPQLQKLLREV